ncbi:cell division suppressor protein YneA [Ureibacillus manganicus]|uniref:cell division suppressor protein YneA n=1 Tax=Ureibacillus manganicus TaxID=1266064 RepID=UPI000AD359EC|nr:LysM peptidoglycan-binding domain-containing protein [Ureibacillus manganicus]
MNWLKKNSYIKVLLTAFLLIAGYVLITDDGETTYKQIEVQHGDSLWSLAEKYRGSTPTHEWIKTVQIENNLDGEIIVAGRELTIPLEAAVIMAQDFEQDETEVKVATNNQ